MKTFIICNALVILLLLIVMCISDIRHRIISNNIVLGLLVAIVPFSLLTTGNLHWQPAALTLFGGFLLFWLRAIGGGDVKLLTVLMLATPSDQAFMLLFFTALFGLVVIVIGALISFKALKQKGVPYGVAIACAFVLLQALSLLPTLSG